MVKQKSVLKFVHRLEGRFSLLQGRSAFFSSMVILTLLQVTLLALFSPLTFIWTILLCSILCSMPLLVWPFLCAHPAVFFLLFFPFFFPPCWHQYLALLVMAYGGGLSHRGAFAMLVGYGLSLLFFFSVTWPCDKTVLDLLLTLTMIFIDDMCCIENHWAALKAISPSALFSLWLASSIVINLIMLLSLKPKSLWTLCFLVCFSSFDSPSAQSRWEEKLGEHARTTRCWLK